MSNKMFLNAVEVEAAINKINDDLKLFQDIKLGDVVLNKTSAAPGAFDQLVITGVDCVGSSFCKVFEGCISIYDLRAFFGECIEQLNQRMVDRLLGI